MANVNKALFLNLLLALGIPCVIHGQASAPAPGKLGTINTQTALGSTKEGQKAARELQSKLDTRAQDIRNTQNQIAALQEQLQKGSSAMTGEARQNLARDIERKTKLLNRDIEDARAEADREQHKVLQTLGQKLMVVIDKYARDNGYGLILDAGSPQSPVLFAASAWDITKDIVALYDKNHPVAPEPASPVLPKSPVQKKPAGED